ncbi:uncharacterized protein LOC117295601 [Asterias rubens]|uniref:uncharacterized protein LOC117295601 n=1 Tax=Asterias rubens TaxID=7604 RepID=UPI0014559299|nr:uncharacterized protein LOC117295601 [Asterias rubens]
MGINTLSTPTGLVREPRQKATVLNQQFNSGFTKEDLSNIPNHDLSAAPPVEKIQNNVEGVEKLQKASGPDGIPARVLKEYSNSIAPISKTLPEILGWWNTSYRLERSKRHTRTHKGRPFKPANYRPIPLTSICCKTLEQIHSHIMLHLKVIISNHMNNIVFVRKDHVKPNLLMLKMISQDAYDSKSQMDLIIIDKVPH